MLSESTPAVSTLPVHLLCDSALRCVRNGWGRVGWTGLRAEAAFCPAAGVGLGFAEVGLWVAGAALLPSHCSLVPAEVWAPLGSGTGVLCCVGPTGALEGVPETDF